MLTINVSTLVFGKEGNQNPLPEVTLKLVSQQLSAKEIIVEAVKEQLSSLLKEQRDYQAIRNRFDSQYLNEHDIKQQAESGKIALDNEEKGEISLDREIERVLTAFNNKRFKMFVDGDEIQELEELCVITEGTKVNFVRLIPLAGG